MRLHPDGFVLYRRHIPPKVGDTKIVFAWIPISMLTVTKEGHLLTTYFWLVNVRYIYNWKNGWVVDGLA